MRAAPAGPGGGRVEGRWKAAPSLGPVRRPAPGLGEPPGPPVLAGLWEVWPALGGSPPSSGTAPSLELLGGPLARGFRAVKSLQGAGITGAVAGRSLPRSSRRKTFPDLTGWLCPVSTFNARELGCKDSRSGCTCRDGLCVAGLGSFRTVYHFPC